MVDGTGDVKSIWAVYVAPNHLTLQELFNSIHAGKLFLFVILKHGVRVRSAIFSQYTDWYTMF